MKTRVPVTFICLLFASYASAQVVAYGGKAGGVGSSFYTRHMGQRVAGRSTQWPEFGLAACGSVYYYLNKQLYLNGEVGYIQEGSNVELDYTHYLQYKQGYVHVPIMAKYVLAFSRLDLRYVKAGIYNNVLVHTRVSEEGLEPAYYKIDYTDRDNIKGYNFGIVLGGGFEWLIRQRKSIISAEIRYLLSLSKMNKGLPEIAENQAFPKYHALMITLGYMIYKK